MYLTNWLNLVHFPKPMRVLDLFAPVFFIILLFRKNTLQRSAYRNHGVCFSSPWSAWGHSWTPSTTLTNTRPNPCWPPPTIFISASKFTITYGCHDRDFHYILIIPILDPKFLFHPHSPSSDDYNYVWNRQRISALAPIQGESNQSPPRAFYTMVTNLCTGLRTNNIIVVRRTQISWLTPRCQ